MDELELLFTNMNLDPKVKTQNKKILDDCRKIYSGDTQPGNDIELLINSVNRLTISEDKKEDTQKIIQKIFIDIINSRRYRDIYNLCVPDAPSYGRTF